MNVAHCDEDLDEYLGHAVAVSKEYPVVISKFIDNAKVLYASQDHSQGNRFCKRSKGRCILLKKLVPSRCKVHSASESADQIAFVIRYLCSTDWRTCRSMLPIAQCSRQSESTVRE